MMKPAQRLSFLNSSGVHRHTSSLVRRAVLVLSLLVFCLGSVWGQEYVRYELEDIGYAGGSNDREHRTISQSEYSKYDTGSDCFVEVTFIANARFNQTIGAFSTAEGWENIVNITANVNADDQFSIRCPISTLDEAIKNKSDKRIAFNIWTSINNNKAATFSKAEVLVPNPDDPFLNTASQGVSGVEYSDNSKNINIDLYGSFTLSKIKEQISNLPDIKYARIYVTKDGKKVDYNTEFNGNNLLEVTGGKKAGKSEQNGLYVYNGGNPLDLNAINVTLNAGAGNLDKYKVVVLLSTSAADEVSGENVTKEPQWNYKYTYSFIYPIEAAKVKYKTIAVKNDNGGNYLQPILVENWFELAGDCGAEKNFLANNLYLHWYLMDQNDQVVSFHTQYATLPTNDTNAGGNATWTANTHTLTWTGAYDNQLRNIGLPKGDIRKYKKLVVDCEIIEGNRFRIMFYDRNNNDHIVLYVTESGVNEFIIPDALQPFNDGKTIDDYLANCYEICLSGDNINAKGSVVINAVYMEEEDTGNGDISNFHPTGKGGYYRNGGFESSAFTVTGNKNTNTYKPKFYLPKGVDYNNIRLVCVATTKKEGYTINNNQWEKDPEEIQVKYIYTLKSVSQLESQPFVHYQGEAYRYLTELNDEDASAYQYLDNVGEAVNGQKVWNIEKNDYEGATTTTIRQNVHTVEYTYYVTPGQTGVELILPLQEYSSGGSSTEPRAYFRWYDYLTDMKSGNLTPKGDELDKKNNNRLVYNIDVSRGIFALMTGDPNSQRIGVTFNAPDVFGENDEIQIACDVSRYMDGMDESFTYLVHEPTLSIRYLFRIKSAYKIAKDIAKSVSLSEVEKQVRTSGRPTVLEDEGRMVVSTNDGYGEFALRTKLSSLGNYYIGENNPQPAQSLWWYAYYFDGENWWRHLIPNMPYRDRDGRESYIWGNPKTPIYRTQSHQAKYSLATKQWPDYNNITTNGDFEGTWLKWNGTGWETSGTASPKIGVGDRVEMVGCVDVEKSANNTNATPSNVNDNTKVMPIIWMELEFINAKPVELDGILNAKETDNDKSNWKRTAGYMRKEYDHAETLKFDDFSVVGMRQPKHSAENYNSVPLHYPNAQYGFIYPQLYGYCATMRLLNWGGSESSDGYFGMAPMHGDYTLLKSMNMPGISMDKEGLNQGGQSMQVDWVNINRNVTLFDVTYESNNGKRTTDNNDYGGFIYVDAADEARTIASLEFDANLCTNAKIYYTAYVASMTGYTQSKEVNGSTQYGRNETNGTPQTAPMLRFRVSTENENGERVPVVTFVTGNIRQEVSYENGSEQGHLSSKFREAQWYQVYGYTTIPAELNAILTDGGLNGKKRHYFVEIDNYCDNTDGADYCVDQISFYTYSAQVRANVDFDKCEGEHEKTTVRVNADAKSLISLIDTGGSDNGETGNIKTLYYRIYERLTGTDATLNEAQAVTGEENEMLYTLNDGSPNKLYGSVSIDIAYYNAHIDDKSMWNEWFGTKENPKGYVGEKSHSGFYVDKDEEGNDAVFFQIFNANFILDPEKSYFISFYDPSETVVPTNEDIGVKWGHPYADNDCSMYSNDIKALKIYIELIDDAGDGSFNGDVQLGCGGIEVEKTYNIKVRYPNNEGEYKIYSGIQFDFFAYSGEKNARELFIDKTNFPQYYNLMEALRKFRDVFELPYTNPDDLPTEYKDGYTEDVRNLLIEWMNGDAEQGGKLLLAASTTLKHTFTAAGEKHFAAFPVQRTTSPTSQEEICSPMDIQFNVDGSIGYPQMRLGFDDVVYPETYTKQVVRVGLKQLEMMKESNYKLHIPVQSYSDKVQKRQALYFLTGQTDKVAYLTISAIEEPTEEEGTTAVENAPKKPNTTDPVLLGEGENAIGKKFAKIEPLVSGKSPYVDNDHMYLSLDLSKCDIDFHEGYEYEVSTSFMAEEDLKVEVPCLGDLFLVIKVVPEYVTWDAQLIEPKEGQENDKYYSANWYDDKNWSRSKHNELYKTEDAYKDGQDMNPAPSTYPGYVPMKFTYVTLLTKNHAPSLIAEPKVKEQGKSADNQGGSLIDPSEETGTDMTSASSPFDENMPSVPTTDIRYDMMVRYIGTAADGTINGGGCFGHRKISENDGWVDATTANPSEQAFDVEKFYGNWAKEIYFKPGAELVYQQFLKYGKAWVEKELEANKWYLMSTPLKATYAGDMYVPYNETDADKNGKQETEAFEKINFTDADITYSRTGYPVYQKSWDHGAGTGNAGNVYTKDNVYSANLQFTGSVTTTFAQWTHTYNDMEVRYDGLHGFALRAHKNAPADATALLRLPKADETYTYYDYEGKEGGKTASTSKTGGYARFVTDDCDESNRGTALITKSLHVNINADNSYYLIGNPYMASLDMAKFFEKNSNLTGEYWKIDDNASQAGLETGQVRPLESFFVKLQDANNTSISFTSGMMIDGNHPTAAPNPVRPMTMTAATPRGQSAANVSVGEEVKSVATLFDSNLNDVPMVYTVADGQAVSINQVTGLDKPIAFGVTCAANDEPVDVTFSDIAQLTSGEVYVVDAANGSKQQVTEGGSYSVQPNDYGRYFLTFAGGTTGISEAAGIGVVVSVRGRMVTVTSGETLTEVRAISPDGATVHRDTAGSTTASFTLAPGVYIVKAENAAGEQQTVKVIVK